MIWADFLSGGGVAVPVLGSVALVVAGVVLWFVNAHRQQLKEQLVQLQHELDLAAVKAERAQERAEAVRSQHAGAVAENAELAGRLTEREGELFTALEQKITQEGLAEKYFAAGKREHLRCVELEQARDVLRTERDTLLEQITRASLKKAKKRRAERRARRQEPDAAREPAQLSDGRVWEAPLYASAPAFLPLATRHVPIVAVLNLKGGVGKTTIAANLAGHYNSVDKRTLLVDLDHQRSLSQMMFSNIERERIAHLGKTVQHYLTETTPDGPALVNRAERVPGLPHVSLMSNTDLKAENGRGLDDLEMELMAEWQRCRPDCPDVRLLFRSGLHNENLRLHFNQVIFDCPPRLTTACVNALAASDLVLIPVQAEAVALRSVQHLLHRLDGLRRAGVLGAAVQLAVVANMVPKRGLKPHSTESQLLAVAERVATHFWGSPVPFLHTKIPYVLRYADATQKLDAGGSLKLAIEYPTIRGVYRKLASELRGLVDEHVGVAGVPA